MVFVSSIVMIGIRECRNYRARMFGYCCKAILLKINHDILPRNTSNEINMLTFF